MRVMLRSVGIALYHLGLSRLIVNLSPDRARALLYHSVEETPGSYTVGLKVNVTPATFAMHMDYVRTHYSGSTIEQVVEGTNGPCPALITFDDGYASVEQHAVPILEKCNLPATVYLIGSAVSTGRVWVNELNHAIHSHPETISPVLASYPSLEKLDHADIIRHVQSRFTPAEIEHLMQQLTVALSSEDGVISATATADKLFSSADDIKSMQRRGIAFGFHTQDHYNLKLCDDKTLTRQLDRTGVAPLLNSNTFAYPFGYYSLAATRKLTQQNYLQLMTVGSGTSADSYLHKGRSEVFGITPAAVFAQLEVEEPVMAVIRQSLRQLLSFFKGSGIGSVGIGTSHTLPDGQSHLPIKNDIPETSKPR